MANQHFEHLAGPHSGISLPTDERIYAVGDIHGRRDLLDKINEMIATDAERSPIAKNTVIYLGDYVDRGPESSAVLDALSTQRLHDFETVHLMGNHDFYMIRFLDGEANYENWLDNGGDDTLASYGVPVSLGPERARRTLLDTIPPHHRAFLEHLKLSHRIGNVVFAHAGIDPTHTPDDQVPEKLMWIREPFLDWPHPMDVVVVHGHTPRPEPEVAHHRVGVDTLAWRSGTLTAAVLENGGVRFLST